MSTYTGPKPTGWDKKKPNPIEETASADDVTSTDQAPADDQKAKKAEAGPKQT